MPNQRRLLLVMNGRSTRGTADRFCGFTDPPLSAEGRQSVLELRQKLANDGERLPKIWYVSDRRRSLETFEIMSAGMHAPVVRIMKALRDINFGDFENLTWEELPADFQRQYEASLANPMNLKFPGGESFRGMCDRVTGGALEILAYDLDDADIGIVAHQGSLRLWMMIAEDLPPQDFFRETPELASYKRMTMDVSRVAAWRRKYLDDH